MKGFSSRLFARFARADRQSTGDEFSLDLPYARRNEDGHADITPEHITSRRFRRRLLGGLDPEEVAAFVDEVAVTLDTAQRLQLETERQVRFLEEDIQALTLKQMSVSPPDAFQDAERQPTSPDRADEREEDAAAARRLEVLRSTTLQEVEALLHDAHARAQALTDAANERAATILREADALKSGRQREAEQLVAEATATAESILMTVRDQEAALRNELGRLAEGRLRILDDVWATLNACQEWLATIDPRRRGPEEREARVDRVA